MNNNLAEYCKQIQMKLVAIRKTALFILIGLSTTLAHSQNLIPPDLFPNIAGIGIGRAPEFTGSSDEVTGVAPGIRYKLSGYRYIDLWGPLGSVNLVDSPNWQAGPMLNYRFGRSDVDDAVVSQLEEIDATWEGGAFVSYSRLSLEGIPWRFRIGIGALTDLGNRHEGNTVFAWSSVWVPLHRKVFLGFGASLGYGSSDFMQTYYGVNQQDADSSGLTRFQADSGIKSYSLWPALIVQLSDKWAVGTGFLYQQLTGDASDSPIVAERGSSSQYIFGLGVGYLWK